MNTKNFGELLSTPKGRGYIARRLLEACLLEGEIKNVFKKDDELRESSDIVIRIVKAREFDQGYVSFKE